jgi:5-methyltetrahydropteroyltriglutamate--homocysteine methyltransferase
VHNTDRMLTTHVGSLVRPPALRSIIEARRDGQPYDQAEYERVLRSSVADVVRQQAEAGVDIVSDGEFGKSFTWAAYVNERLGGIEYRKKDFIDASAMRQSRDAREFPDFYIDYMLSQNFEPEGAGGWECVGPLSYTGQETLQRDIDNLKAGLADVDVTAGFLPVVAPASVAGVGWSEGPYATEEEFVYAVAEALRTEYTTILDAGLLLQIDDAFLPWTYDLMVPPATMEEYRAWARLRVEALNHALRGIPRELTRFHCCWGSWHGPHSTDLPMADLVDMLVQIDVGSYSFEAANARHEHEWRVWQDAKVPDDVVLVPGVVGHATNVLEHPELVADRIERFTRIVGSDRVIAATDCGLGGRVHPQIAWAKLESLAQGAQLASARV